MTKSNNPTGLNGRQRLEPDRDYRLNTKPDPNTLDDPKSNKHKELLRVPPQEFTQQVRHRKKRKFLDSLVYAGGNSSQACRLANINLSTPHFWVKNDPEFAALWREAQGIAAATLENEAIRRGFQGYEIPVGWHKGEPGAFVTQYSDILLIFLLKGAFPEKYADRMEVKGAMANIDLARLPDEALSRIAAGEHPNSVLASIAQGALSRGEIEVPALPPGQPEPTGSLEPAPEPGPAEPDAALADHEVANTRQTQTPGECDHEEET